jgi:hypothetical protein
MNMLDVSEVVKQLEALSISDLKESKLPTESLLAVLRDATLSSKSRLFAAEILFSRDPTSIRDLFDASTLAAVYVNALRESGVDLNGWAFLTLEEIGPFGQRLISFGEEAVVALVPLLDSCEPAGLYSGSIESKEGNSDSPRVCDFAAFFIAKIKRLPYHFYRNEDALRDEEISRLRKNLENSKPPLE